MILARWNACGRHSTCQWVEGIISWLGSCCSCVTSRRCGSRRFHGLLGGIASCQIRFRCALIMNGLRLEQIIGVYIDVGTSVLIQCVLDDVVSGGIKMRSRAWHGFFVVYPIMEDEEEGIRLAACNVQRDGSVVCAILSENGMLLQMCWQSGTRW